MFSVEGLRISLSRGDTGSVDINTSGYTFSAADRALFTVKNGKGQIVKQGVYEITNGSFTVTFYNQDTDALPAGNYSWDVRFVITPQYNDDNEIVDGAQVITPFEPQRLTLIDVVGNI